MKGIVLTSDFESWKHYNEKNIKILFFHLLVQSLKSKDKDRSFIISLGRLEKDLDIPKSSINYSLKTLEKEGLLKTSIKQHLERSLTSVVLNFKEMQKIGISDLNGTLNIKKKNKAYPDQARVICKWFYESLGDELQAAISDSLKYQWLDTITKCNEIEKISWKEIFEIVKWARLDDFWSKNFKTINKLRKTSKSYDMKFIHVFRTQMKEKPKSKTQTQFKEFQEGIEMIRDRYDKD